MRIPSRLSCAPEFFRRSCVHAAGAFVLLAIVIAPPARALDVATFLGIEGALGPGGFGNYPLDADFSWISHRFPGSASAHIWTLAPGSDGGVIMNTAQPGQSQITAARAMYNVPSWLFSVADGIPFDPHAQTFDFTNIRLHWGEDIYDFGFGSTRPGQVPHVASPQDAQSANGWWLDAQGKYHLVFRGDGQCAGCELTVHLTGQMTSLLLGDIAPKAAPDGLVDVADLMRLVRLAAVLEMPSDQELLSADINGDAVIDIRDVLAMTEMLNY